MREFLSQVGTALTKGFKVVVVFILPALAIAMTSPEFREFVESDPALAAKWPLINVVLVLILSVVKQRAPEDSEIKKVL